MANYISYLVTGIFVLTFLELGTPLRCYECKSEFNGNCDNIKGKKLPDEVCEHSKLVESFQQAGSEYVCVKHKMVQKDEPNLSVVRGCAPKNYCTYFPKSIECLSCETDFCNSSSVILPSIVLISILSIILCAKYYL